MDQDRLPEQDTSHPGRWMGATQPRICERLEVGRWQRRLSRPRGKCPVIIMLKGTPPLPWVLLFPDKAICSYQDNSIRISNTFS